MLRCCVLIYLLTVTAFAQVPIGASKSEVIDKLGWPKSTSGSQQREILNYPEFTIFMEEGKVVNLRAKPVEPGKRPRPAPQPKPREIPAKPTPAVPEQNRPLTPEERLGPVPNRSEARQPVAPVPKPRPQVRPTVSSAQEQRPATSIRHVLYPVAILFGVILGLKLVLSQSLKRKLKRLQQGSDPIERYIGAPPPKIVREADLPLYRRPVVADWSLRLLKEIEWHRFEHLVAAYERELGNDAEVTDFGPDGGIDIRVFEKEGRTPKRIIQCKAFDNQLVDVKLVRELVGVMAYEKALQGAFYTTSGFTPPALKLAGGHLEIDLVDGRTFLNRISRLLPDAQARLLAVATEGDYTTPTCSSCGVKMILRTAGKGRSEGADFWGCRHFPRCKQVIKISRTKAALPQ